MTEANRQRGEPTLLRVEGELTIFRAEEIKQALLAEPTPQEIDLSGVTDIDTAGLQLLMLARRSAQAQQRTLRLTAPSAVVTDLFELLGLVGYFGDPLPVGQVRPSLPVQHREVTP